MKLVLQVLLAPPVHKEKLAPQDLQGLPVRKASRERPGQQVPKALLALRDQLVLLAKLAPPVPLVLKVRRAMLVLRDQPVQPDRRVSKAQLDQLGLQEQPVISDPPDRPAQLVQLAQQGHKVKQGQPDLLGKPVPLDHKVQLGLQDQPAPKDLKAIQAILVQQAQFNTLLYPRQCQVRPLRGNSGLSQTLVRRLFTMIQTG